MRLPMFSLEALVMMGPSQTLPPLSQTVDEVDLTFLEANPPTFKSATQVHFELLQANPSGATMLSQAGSETSAQTPVHPPQTVSNH